MNPAEEMGARFTNVLATVFLTLGYLLVYLAFQNLVAGGTIALSVYFFMAGFGSSCNYMTAIGVNANNFPAKKQGLIIGVLLLFYGLSGTIYSQLFNIFFSSTNNVAEFMLMLAISVCVINVMGTLFIRNDNNEGIVFPLDPSPTETQQLVKHSKKDQPPVHDVLVYKTNLVEDEVVVNIAAEELGKRVSFYSPIISLSPRQILASPTFWIYLNITVFAQGITYLSNVTTVIIALEPITTSAAAIAQKSALHVTLISISQSAGRFIFGISSDLLLTKRPEVDRSVFLIVANLIITIPLIFLSLAGMVSITSDLLIFCSICVGLGFGGVGSLFPILTQDFFGKKYYGTACSFLLSPVPIGILLSNWVFGYFYDAALKVQANGGGSTSTCYGTDCFVNSFITILGIQMFPMILSFLILPVRARCNKLQRAEMQSRKK